MGTVDYNDRLYPVYRKATDLCTLLGLDFKFRIDHMGDTSIVFNLDTGKYRQRSQLELWPSYPEIQIVPDICDYNNKIIIEFEEETGNKKSGAKMAKKGHGHEGDPDGTRDERRNECYKRAGFAVHRIWESNFKSTNGWMIALTEFLIEQWRKKCNAGIKEYDKIQDIEA